MWSVSCSLCSWSAVEDTLPSMAQEQCCSVLILPRRAFCVWRALPRVAWGSWGGAEWDPGDAEPRGAGRGQVAVLPSAPRAVPAVAQGWLWHTGHSVTWCPEVAPVCSFPSLLPLRGDCGPKEEQQQGWQGREGSWAWQGTRMCQLCLAQCHGLGHHRGSWHERKASATCHTCHGTAALGDRPLPACPHDECVQLSCSHTNGWCLSGFLAVLILWWILCIKNIYV